MNRKHCFALQQALDNARYRRALGDMLVRMRDRAARDAADRQREIEPATYTVESAR